MREDPKGVEGTLHSGWWNLPILSISEVKYHCPIWYAQCFRNLPGKCYFRHPRSLELDVASKDIKLNPSLKGGQNRLAKSVTLSELLGRRVRQIDDRFRHVGHNPYDCLTWDSFPKGNRSLCLQIQAHAFHLSIWKLPKIEIFTAKCGSGWNPRGLKKLRIFKFSA